MIELNISIYPVLTIYLVVSSEHATHDICECSPHRQVPRNYLRHGILTRIFFTLIIDQHPNRDTEESKRQEFTIA